MLSRLFKEFANRLNTAIIRKMNSIRDKIKQNRMLVAYQLILALKSREISGLPEAEFKVFSKWEKMESFNVDFEQVLSI